MTDQEIFDKVALHLLEYGRLGIRSEDGSGCVYKTDTGLSCAVGCLIPDDLYDPLVEGMSISHFDDMINIGGETGAILEKISEHLGLKDAKRSKLLRGLQQIHDVYLTFDEPNNRIISKHLINLSTDMSLNAAVVTEYLNDQPRSI
jgi:hypothetical protein